MMSLKITSLSALMMAIATTPAVQAAEPIVVETSPEATHLETQIGASNLVLLAYRRYLVNQGIPGYSALLFGYQSGQITARDIVDAAIRAGRLPDSIVNDQLYLSAVERDLDSLVQTSD